MNELEQKELMTLPMALSPFEQKDVLRFVRVRHAQKICYSRPITARQWEQLTKWQKKKIFYTFLLRCPPAAREHIRGKIKHAKMRIETRVIIFLRSFTPSGRAILREWREWERNNRA